MRPFPRPERRTVPGRGWRQRLSVGRGRRGREDKADLAVGVVRAGVWVVEGCWVGEGGGEGGTEREKREQGQEERACCVHPTRSSR